LPSAGVVGLRRNLVIRGSIGASLLVRPVAPSPPDPGSARSGPHPPVPCVPTVPWPARLCWH